jgi:hypothetical protein
MKIKRLTSTDSQNEYIPYGNITTQITSQSLKNVYIMPKIKETEGWSDDSNLSYDLLIEYMAYRPLVSYNEVYHPGYSAQYGQYYQASNPYNEGKISINKGYRFIPQIEYDDD